jgi:23S rRNA G2069 N7-methylase RlmK/C1962 C5-methylase RlmI
VDRWPQHTLSEEDVARQAEMLANRVRKNMRRLAARFERDSIGAYRLYDWDIPEIRMTVDWYEGFLVAAEFERALTRTVSDWLGAMASAAGAAAGVPPERVVVKRRRTRPASGPRYSRLGQGGARHAVREGDLRFWVNLTDYIDTGLFAHHRLTRRLVRAESAGADLLNLYGYTGAFTCAAAAGGARASATVDASGVYLDWARDNLELNGLSSPAHELVRAECRDYLARAARAGRRFTIIVLDPPSFSDRASGQGDFDVLRDHPALLREALAVLAPGGALWFSTNHARFEPRFDRLPVAEIRELTDETTPPDFRRGPHRVWRMRGQGAVSARRRPAAGARDPRRG